MAKLSSRHTNWLPLIEVSGPFLTPGVLDTVFPQGLDAVYPEDKRRLRSLWEEWDTAVDEQDRDLPALHQEWCKRVLTEFLEIPPKVLVAGEKWSVTNDAETSGYAPQYCLVDTEGKPLLFIGIYPPETKLNETKLQEDWPASPVEKMTRLCRRHHVRLGLLTNGEAWSLVNAPLKSLSGTATWYARLWFLEPKTLRAFSSLLNVSRFFGPKNETLPALLDESLEHQEEVTDTLGNQVRSAVEVLIQGLDKADEKHNRELLKDVSSTELYEAGLTVMMRLVFLLCAEERGLLLDDDRYASYYSICTLGGQLSEEADRHGVEVLERRYDAWARLLALFRAVYAGIEHPALRLPALGGSIFNPDKYPFLEGRPKGTTWQSANPPALPIDNRTVLLLLDSLQILEQAGGALRLSYRSLDVESIGHIYEGLLEYTARKTPAITLGLVGTKDFPLPNITLSELETLAQFDKRKLFDRLKELTKRTDTAYFKNRYDKPIAPEALQKLNTACGGDSSLLERIKPFANWLRLDAWEMPLIYPKDSFMVTSGQDRRETGTHYTPKALTVKIVERTLEPLVHVGPSEGLPRKSWTLKSPEELLALKVCDPAMGSGAFLVQSCRYLSERLCESWGLAETQGKFITSTGEVHDTADAEPMTSIAEERLNEARQLVAEKCLYGVDINPMAVELAKLSLWLLTISKGRPFAFLDHNYKSGDSLLGVADIRQLQKFSLEPKNVGFFFFHGKQFSEAISDIVSKRKEIAATVIRDITDVRDMEAKNEEVRRKLNRLKLLADLFTGELFTFTGDISKPKDRQKIANKLEGLSTHANDILNDQEEKIFRWRNEAATKLNLDLPEGKPPRQPFHWALEFPEVFEQGGFDAIVGNPPFSGGQHLTGTFGTAYRNYLVNFIADGTRGSADLCAYFYLRAFSLLRGGGLFGLIACNTIAEGDTRQVGLERMVKQGGCIVAANPNMPWPGSAAVVISLVFFYKDKIIGHVHAKSSMHDGHWHGLFFINDQPVDVISPFLSQREEWSPKVLKANANQSFQGSIVLGLGFTMSEEEAQAYIAKDEKNAEVLFPYLNGEDLNSSPEQKASRWVINFFDWPLDRDAEGSWEQANDKRKKAYLSSGHVPADYPNRVAADFPELLDIVEEKVKPEREGKNDALAAKKWWLFLRPRPELYHAIGRGAAFAQHPKGWEGDAFDGNEVIVVTRVSKTLAFARCKRDIVFADATVIIATSDIGKWAILQSAFHTVYAWQQASKMKSDLRYSPTDAYETFPFPHFENGRRQAFIAMSERFHSLRSCMQKTEQIGLTGFYNAFHNQGNDDERLEELRQLQREIDLAVRVAYGWQDIDLNHGFHAVGYLPANDNIRFTISEEARIEVLKRLSALNKQRWEEEKIL